MLGLWVDGLSLWVEACDGVEGFEEAFVDGGCGLAVELLIDDGFGEGLEGGLGVGEAHGEGASAGDEPGEFGVGGVEVGESGGDVVVWLAGLGGVSHGRYVIGK